jgi:hypothetical protein
MNQDEPTTDLRAALEAAMDDTVESGASAPEALPDSNVNESEFPDNNVQRDEQGRFAPKAEAQPEAQPPAEVAQDGITPGPKPGPRVPEERAPASWSPEVRQHWNNLPPDVRQEVFKREREIQQTLQESAEARRAVESFQKIVAPYEMFIRAENSNPLQAVDNLMATAARLRTANGPELADMVAGIVQQFGVGRFGNSFIEQLDAALSGRVGPAPQNAAGNPLPHLQQAIQQELAPVRQFMSQIEQMRVQQEQRVAQEATMTVEQFLQQAEFGEDVRQEMADILEVASRRGRDMTLQDAYNQAVRMHPSISRIVSQREQTHQGARPLAQRKNAASSVSGSAPMGAPQQSAADIRSAIEAAIEANSR